MEFTFKINVIPNRRYRCVLCPQSILLSEDPDKFHKFVKQIYLQ